MIEIIFFIALLLVLPVFPIWLAMLCVIACLRRIIRHELATKERVEFYKDLFFNMAWGSQGLGAYLGIGQSDKLSAFIFSVVVFLGLMAIVRKLVARLEKFKNK